MKIDFRISIKVFSKAIFLFCYFLIIIFIGNMRNY